MPPAHAHKKMSDAAIGLMKITYFKKNNIIITCIRV